MSMTTASDAMSAGSSLLANQEGHCKPWDSEESPGVLAHAPCWAAPALAHSITSTDSANRWFWGWLQAVSARSAN